MSKLHCAEKDNNNIMCNGKKFQDPTINIFFYFNFTKTKSLFWFLKFKLYERLLNKSLLCIIDSF